MEGHLVQLENGEYLWFNSQTGLHELIQIEQSQVQVNDELEGNSGISFRRTEPSSRDDTNSSLERKNIWNNEQTLLLIDICTKHKERLNNPKFRKTEVYKEISTIMQKHGHPFTSEQCSNRMKTLFTKYKEVRDFNTTSGNNPKKWIYFDVMTEYFGDRPGIIPRATCSSMGIARVESIDENHPSTSNAPKRKPESDEGEKGKKMKRLYERQNPRKEMLTWLKEYKKEVQEREERRLNMVERQHIENKEMLSQILDILKSQSTAPEAK